jgi:2-iminobutanoate/2-iminopropanoate deaminase
VVPTELISDLEEYKMAHIQYDIDVAKHVGRNCDAVEVSPGLRWLYTSGIQGISEDGALPCDIAGQSRLAWANVRKALWTANMKLEDIVKVRTSLTQASDIATYLKIRSDELGDLQPVLMLQVVVQLIRPDVLVEVEVIAASV